MSSLECILSSLLSADNVIRAQAEVAFTKLTTEPDACTVQLCQVIASAAAAAEVRQLASVLIRRVILIQEVSLWTQLTDPAQNHLKQTLLGVLRTSGVPDNIRRLVSDTVGELGVNLVEEVSLCLISGRIHNDCTCIGAVA